MTRAVLFDLGGTLDADGVAWKERFHTLFSAEAKALGRELSADAFAPAFYRADDALAGTIPRSLGLRETARRLSAGIADALTLPPAAAARASRRFADEALASMRASGALFERLAPLYRLGVVSNFYGNLETVLDEGGLRPYLSAAIDSAVVGVEKPDPRIFRTALEELRVEASEALFVGDSLPRDMAGARDAGIPHVWIAPPAADAAQCPSARAVIRSVVELGGVLQPGRIVAGGVIAAGDGSRLRRDGYAPQKPLVPVAGVPLVERVVANLQAAGIRDLSIIFNEEGRGGAAFVRGRFPALSLDVLVKTTPSSLASFREILARMARGRALISTVDAVLSRQAFMDFVRRAGETPADATVLAVTPFVDDENPLWVTLDAGSRVARIGGSSGGTHVTAGLYVIPERLRSATPPPGLGRLREYLVHLVESGEPVIGLPIEKVVDVDRGADVAVAESVLAAADRRSAR